MNDLRLLFDTPDLEVMTVVHGNCPTGADRAAKAFCESMRPWTVFMGRDVVEEPHNAAWSAYGPAAGNIRNGEMVDTGADICLAYPTPACKGTIDCMVKASAAKIMVINRAL